MVIFTLLMNATPSSGQELVSVSDITGGSSVFVFRSSAKAAPKKFVSKTRTVRTKTQRIETARKFSKQFITLAKVTPRRNRSTTVQPDDPRLKQIKVMPKEEASSLFAGVGEFYMDRDDFDHAIDFFRESSALDPKNARAKTGLSEALALKGNDLLVKDSPAAARKFFEEALTYNSNNAPASFGLAEVFASLEKDDEARTNYEKALANDKDLTEIYVPLGILYYQQGQIAKADELLTKAMVISPDDPQTQYFLGLIRYSQNRNDDALTAFRRATKADPGYAEAFYQSGETLLRLSKPAEAVADFTKATTLKLNYFEAWLGLGNAYYESNNLPEAVRAYKEAVRLKNDSWVAFENLGDAYRQMSNFNDAEANYKLAALFIERTPDFSKEQAADIYSKSAFMIAKQCELNMARAMRCRWGDAVTALEKASKYSQTGVDDANLGWAYYNAARDDLSRKDVAAARPKLEKAKIALQKAAASNPKFVAGPMMNLGMALSDLGDYAGAVDALTKAVQKEPNWAFALNELGIAYRKQDKLKEAAAQFRKAVDKNDKFAAAYYNLGEAEFKNGNLGEAKKAWERLRRLGRNDLAAQLEIVTGGKVKG